MSHKTGFGWAGHLEIAFRPRPAVNSVKPL